MIIDCDSCTVRGAACTDCVVTFLTIPVRADSAEPVAPPGRPVEAHRGRPSAQRLDLDEAERGAIEVLARSGMVPPLRMARGG